jgi:hypothetical protein
MQGCLRHPIWVYLSVFGGVAGQVRFSQTVAAGSLLHGTFTDNRFNQRQTLDFRSHHLRRHSASRRNHKDGATADKQATASNGRLAAFFAIYAN